MFGFIFGMLMGFGAKMAYDFFQEERIPTDLGMSQGRAEAIMDETRQIVREIRDELRSAAVATQDSVSEKIDRLRVAGASEANGAPSTSGADASPTRTSIGTAGSGHVTTASAESSETGPVGPGYGGTSDASEADDAPEGGAEDEEAPQGSSQREGRS
jgi:hypothetical protein